MAFPLDPGRPPGIQPLENLVPDQGNVDPRAMLPLAPAREQQHHDVRQHAGLGHVQHDEDMNLEDMLPLRQAFNLDQDDAMLEDDNNQLREQNAVAAARADRAKGSSELGEALAIWAQFRFFYFPCEPSHNALEGRRSVKSCYPWLVAIGSKALRCTRVTAWLKVQGKKA